MQQGVWHMPVASMPLAAGYLSAMVQADAQLSSEVSVRIENFSGQMTMIEMASRMLRNGTPDIAAFSVFGWNYRSFGEIASTVKLANPNAVVIFGGTHVSNQAERLFHDFPAVDVLINGEGESTFLEVVRAVVRGDPIEGIPGTAVNRGGTVVLGESRPRITDLDSIPSPLLTGAIDITDPVTGEFRYDAALLETNRGCPYKCAFCYWGGAVGERVRSFSRERLRAEVELLSRAKVGTLVLCDANFGMRQEDLEFARIVIEAREKYGYPQRLESSWAKNKSAVFYQIVEELQRADLKSSFTLALQTLDDEVLRSMRRKNMQINDWKHLARWLRSRDLDCYAELIWGSPGETVEGFLEGYDRLACEVHRIAIYPLILIPNTSYHESAADSGLITVRGDGDDFLYVLASRSVTIDQSLEMFQFIFWARLLSENMVLRSTWRFLPALLGMTQSELIKAIANEIDQSSEEVAQRLSEYSRRSAGDADSLADALALAFRSAGFDRVVMAAMEPLVARLPETEREAALDAVRLDLEARPFPGPGGGRHPEARWVERDGATFWEVRQSYAAPVDGHREVTLRFPTGFEAFCSSTNHEITAAYVAEVIDEVEVGSAGRWR
jgi:radical SAM superfamily enzyme YgiQ (UPF0313 family)